jgi:RNA polymerase sigma-70 factor (ECF subfamily)
LTERVAYARRESGQHNTTTRARSLTFEELYRRDFHSLVALAYGLSGSRMASEEVVQEAFLAAHRRWNKISRYDDPSLWVRRVVLNRSVSAIRRRVAEARALTRLRARPTRPHVLPELEDELWKAVRKLPAHQAKAIVLHYVDDCSVAEIAEILGVSDGTVKTHLHRARRALAGALDHSAPRRTHED